MHLHRTPYILLEYETGPETAPETDPETAISKSALKPALKPALNTGPEYRPRILALNSGPEDASNSD